MILVTGSTGEIGGRVARLLVERGVPLRLLSRDAARAPALPGAQIVTGDYAQPSSLDAAFAGVDAALIVSGYAKPMERALLHKNAFEAAARAGVGHVVYTSFQGAAPDSKFPMSRDHHQSEAYLKESGVSFTALRDSLYQDIVPHLFDSEGCVRGPAGNGKAAWVARDDVAAVIAQLLVAPPEKSATLDVTGPEALDLDEIAARLSKILGRELVYEPESVEAGRAWRSKTGAPDWEIDTWLGSYEAMQAGELGAVSQTVSQILGRPPITIEECLARHPELLKDLRRNSSH
ncbi:MAG: SDR family oxidoreductase [Leptospiraceae bacterium]|nr:SDR family oxidoreductase [Leptospiraceae bacterium]